MPEKEKSLSRPRDNAFKLTWRKLDRSNSKKKLLPWLSKQESKERTTCTRFRNKSRLNFKKERLKRIENRLLSTILTKLEARLMLTMT